MDKKKFLTLLLFIFSFSFIGCSSKEKLLILNWGEYINEDLVKDFESEYNCRVIISVAESNELFYSKIKSGTTAYDLVIPSDYMVEKMYKKELLQPFDLQKLENYNIDNFVKPVQTMLDNMFDSANNYAIPYFWGTFGIMYNKEKEGLKEAVLQNELKTLFEKDAVPAGTRIGMYNVPRFSYAAAMFYNNMSPNLEDNNSIKIAEKSLTQINYDSWGTDTLKHHIASNNLDLAYVYTGDFLDVYYSKLEAGYNKDTIPFDIFIPDQTIAFLDSIVMPKKARHIDLAHKFVDFMLRPEVAFNNAGIVGYCTTLKESYQMILDQNNDYSYALKTYYPLVDNEGNEIVKGTVLHDLKPEFLNNLTILINNIKSNRN
jgi:spermidine/putrescine-binding protein